MTTELAPLFAVFGPLNAQIARGRCAHRGLREGGSIATRLTTAPGVGPVTASAFVATIDDITRFRTAHKLEAYLGVIPSERSSGEKRQLGHITKSGNGRMRWLLVEAAWQILGLVGLLPQKRGPRQAHKLTDDVLAVLATARTEAGAVLSTTALVHVLHDQFAITAHPRSIERSLLRYAQRWGKKGP